MTRGARRRRAAVLLSLALAAGGLAASEVRGRVEAVERRVGEPVPVVVAREDLPAGARLDGGRVARALELRSVPARFVPPDSLADPGEAVGLRLSVPLARGSYLTAAALGPGEEEEERAPGPALRRGERAVEIAVAGTGGPAGGAAPGARVDVLVTTEDRAGARGRTYVALEAVELLALRPAGAAAAGADAAGGGPDGGDGGAAYADGADGGGEATGANDGADAPGADGAAAAADGQLATLRVKPHQAVFLTAAQSFARELRLLVRPPGDRRPSNRAPIASGDL